MRTLGYRIELVLSNGLWYAEIWDDHQQLAYRTEGYRTRGLAHADASLWIVTSP